MVMSEKNKLQKGRCVVPGYLFLLTIIQEQMAKAVSWVRGPYKQEVGDDKGMVISQGEATAQRLSLNGQMRGYSISSGITSNNSVFAVS